MRRRSTVLLLALLALCLAPALASASSENVTSTHAYIQANYTLGRAIASRLGLAQTRIEQLNGRFKGECPGVGDGSPENEASQPISHEVAVADWSIAYGTDLEQIRTFAKKVRHLRWSNSAITHHATRYATDLLELATLPVPDLCQDVASWKASGFQVIPPAVANLVERVEAIEPRTVSQRLLAPDERGSDASVVSRTSGLETKLAEFEFMHGQIDWEQLLEILGLNE